MLLSLAASGCVAESLAPPAETQSMADELTVAPRITRPAKGQMGNARLDAMVAAGNADSATRGRLEPYMLDMRTGRTGVVRLVDARAIAGSLFGAQVLSVAARELLPSQPFALAPSVRLLGQSVQIAAKIGADEPASSALAFAISGLDPRTRLNARIYEVTLRPGTAGPQSVFLFFDEGVRGGRGVCVAADANMLTD